MKGVASWVASVVVAIVIALFGFTLVLGILTGKPPSPIPVTSEPIYCQTDYDCSANLDGSRCIKIANSLPFCGCYENLDCRDKRSGVCSDDRCK